MVAARDQQVTLTIDGRSVTVPAGTKILEAARSAGISISYFCYHPGLSAPAVCRQCLVEVVGQPKPVPSCYVPVAEKMEVRTQSAAVLQARRQMLEFTLLNHPVDCPICDKAGECILQKLYMEWDGAPSQTTFDKVHKPKAVDLGPHIVLDAERCILCTRCMRVCDEVAGSHQLEMMHRGDRQTLDVAPGQRLDHPYSLNTVDVCPVGALTAKDFRFTMRAWELYATPSVCPGCASGCNIEIHHAQNKIWRLVPRPNPDVNRYWMCDEGRFAYQEVTWRRVVGARVTGEPAPLDKAVAFAAQRLADARAEGKLAVILGTQASNEDLYLVSKIAFDHLGLHRVFVAGRRLVPEREDQVLRSPDVNPNSAGARLLARGLDAGLEELERTILEGRLTALWAIGEDVPLSEAAQAALAKVDVIVQASHEGLLVEHARVVLPAALWAEVDGTITNRQGRVQRLRRALDPPGDAQPHWRLALSLARGLGLDLEARDERAIFEDMRATSPSLAKAEWGAPAPAVQLRFARSRG